MIWSARIEPIPGYERFGPALTDAAPECLLVSGLGSLNDDEPSKFLIDHRPLPLSQISNATLIGPLIECLIASGETPFCSNKDTSTAASSLCCWRALFTLPVSMKTSPSFPLLKGCRTLLGSGGRHAQYRDLCTAAIGEACAGHRGPSRGGRACAPMRAEVPGTLSVPMTE